jgi:hypothetical protein
MTAGTQSERPVYKVKRRIHTGSQILFFYGLTTAYFYYFNLKSFVQARAREYLLTKENSKMLMCLHQRVW